MLIIHSQSVMRLKSFQTAGLCLLLALAARADVQSSAHYLVTNESVDNGGARAVSADYANDGSFSDGDFAGSADYAQRGGYVGGLNNAPVATNYTLVVYSNNTVKVPISQLLSAVSDADGDTVTFVSAETQTAQSGLTGQVGKWFLYRPPQNYNGTDQFTWVVQDSEGDRSTGTIYAQVGAPPVDNAPTLNLISITFDNAPGATDARLRFGGLPQATYQVQYTDDLTPPITWTTLGSSTVTNGVFTIVDPTAKNASQRYYRTMIQ